MSSGKEQRIRNGVDSFTPNSAEADSRKSLYCVQNSSRYVQMNIGPPMPRRSSKALQRTFPWRESFLAALARDPQVKLACKAAGIRATLCIRICERMAGFAGSGNMLLVKGRPRSIDCAEGNWLLILNTSGWRGAHSNAYVCTTETRGNPS